MEVSIEGYDRTITYVWYNIQYDSRRYDWEISCFRSHLQTCASQHDDPQSIFEELIYAVETYNARPYKPGQEMSFIWWLSQQPKPVESDE